MKLKLEGNLNTAQPLPRTHPSRSFCSSNYNTAPATIIPLHHAQQLTRSSNSSDLSSSAYLFEPLSTPSNSRLQKGQQKILWPRSRNNAARRPPRQQFYSAASTAERGARETKERSRNIAKRAGGKRSRTSSTLFSRRIKNLARRILRRKLAARRAAVSRFRRGGGEREGNCSNEPR